MYLSATLIDLNQLDTVNQKEIEHDMFGFMNLKLIENHVQIMFNSSVAYHTHFTCD